MRLEEAEGGLDEAEGTAPSKPEAQTATHLQVLELPTFLRVQEPVSYTGAHWCTLSLVVKSSAETLLDADFCELGPRDREMLAGTARRFMARLKLTGFDDADVLFADVWMETPQFRRLWELRFFDVAYDLAAFLGEAVVQQSGGRWVRIGTGRPPAVAVGDSTVHPFPAIHLRRGDRLGHPLLRFVRQAAEEAARAIAPVPESGIRPIAMAANDQTARTAL